jgi:hypothetical protein
MGSGANPATDSVSIVGFFPGIKWLNIEAGHSLVDSECS